MTRSTVDHQWQTGVARVDITPREPIAMAGWGGHRISEGATHPLWARALALRDAGGQTAVLVTTDLLGLSRSMSEELAQRAHTQFGLRREQLVINSSHNHAGPVTGDLLHLYYELSDEELQVVERYTHELLDNIILCIGEALQTMAPSTLWFEQGLCGFGVNRRRDQSARMDYSNARALPQVVDHDVPVLMVRGLDDHVRAIVFGYACHPTAYAVPRLCGDWPGFAQLELEQQFEGATAMFVAGCGGDINPLPRFGRFHEKLPEMFGTTLAASVCNVLDAPMRSLHSSLSCVWKESRLKLEAPASPLRFENMLEDARNRYGAGTRVRELEYQIAKVRRGEALATSTPFPIHLWQIGDLKWIALSGEPVVDYSLRFKRQFGAETTWVAGYCNELTAYIPSRRVLREGGYEGKDGMMEYGWPAAFCPAVEDVIGETVDDLSRQLQQ